MMPKPLPLLFALLCAILCAPASVRAADEVVFTRDIAPLLVQKCQGCHGPQKQKGGYRLDTFDRFTHPGDSEAAPITPGRPEASELFRLITHPDPKKRMPQKDDPLPAAQVALIENWIRQGGKFDGPDRGALQSLIRVTHPSAPPTYPHPVPAVALAFRPDGSALAVGGYHEITLWDPATGKLLGRIGNVPQQTHALAWSPDGALLAAAGGTPGALGELRLISPSDPTNARVLDRIGDVMLSTCFSPDGKTLAAGGADGALCVYDVATGNRTLRIEPHADWVTAVAFSPDGSKVATASRDKSARVFDVHTGEVLSAYLGHEEPIFALAWDEGAKRLYTGGRDKQVHAWEPTSEPKKQRDFKGFTADVLRLAVIGDHLFSTCADGKLRQFNRSTGELVRTIDATPDWLPGLAIDAGRHRLAVGAFDGTVKLYDTATVAPTTSFVAAPGH